MWHKKSKGPRTNGTNDECVTHMVHDKMCAIYKKIVLNSYDLEIKILSSNF